jgi:hypothetical protein
VNILRRIKWTIQKLFRGYSDCDLWGLTEHIAEFMVKRLKAFRKMHKNGTPIFEGESIDDVEKDDTDRVEKWNGIIDSMIFAFDFILKDFGNDYDGVWGTIKEPNPNAPMGIPCEDNSNLSTFNPDWLDSYHFNSAYYNKLQKKYEEGMKNFVDYLGSLWD